MFFFNKKIKLKETDFFKDFTDCHCHILYSVDDGVRTLEESLKVLYFYESLGIKRVVLTPHVMDEVKVSWEERSNKFNELCRTYNGKIDLRLSGEYMLDECFKLEIESGIHPLFDKNVLVETSFMSAPYNMEQQIYELKLAGFTPVIAHPERYMYMNYDEYDKLLEQGCKFQLNIPSLAGNYGGKVKERALKLLLEHKYSFIGTDLHNIYSFKNYFDKLSLKKKEMDALLSLKDNMNKYTLS